MTDTSVFEDKKAAYYTLGCKLNFAETSTIGRSLLAQGVRSVRPREVADICVINTCSVTELADKKCRTMIRKAAREHPGSFVVVTGCYAQLSPEEIADIEGVHLVIGSEKKLDIADYLDLERPRDAGASIVRGRTKDIRTFRLSSSSDERTRGLYDEFRTIKYEYRGTALLIESKDSLKRRGESSPDTIDAICYASMPADIIDGGGPEKLLDLDLDEGPHVDENLIIDEWGNEAWSFAPA